MPTREESYGRSVVGVALTDEVLEQIAEEAEAGLVSHQAICADHQGFRFAGRTNREPAVEVPFLN